MSCGNIFLKGCLYSVISLKPTIFCSLQGIKDALVVFR
jgi:hypothetical protein